MCMAEAHVTKKAESKAGPQQPEISMQRVGRQDLRTAVWHGTGEKRAILFFNGIGANLELIAPLAHALPDRDIVTFDMPGIGQSAMRICNPISGSRLMM